MVVRVAVTTRRPAHRDYWSLVCAKILLAVIAVQPTPTQSASLPSIGTPNPPLPTSQAQVFDPAAAALFSMWSYGAMSVIAPIIYGDFVPPTALTSSFGLSASAPMPLTAGSDPAVASVLDATLLQGLLPAGGAAEAEEFDVGSGGRIIASGGAVIGWSVPSVGLNGAIPTIGTVGEAGAIQATSTAGGIQSVCVDDQMEKRLQAGGQFWNGQAASAMPVQFPPGVFSRPVELGNPLAGLGPAGNPTNLPPPGPAGSWCRPPHGPFSESSPLEDRAFWIGAGVVLVSVLVFWLTRGMKIPAHSFDDDPCG